MAGLGPPLELENDNLWAALTYAREACDTGRPRSRRRSPGTVTVAERVCEGRRFLEGALSAVSKTVPIGERVELLAFLCYLATEELDLDAAIEIGERALAVARTERRNRNTTTTARIAPSSRAWTADLSCALV